MKKKIIFYQSYFSPIGGVETFAYNWCWWLRNYYDITILHNGGDGKRLSKMSRLGKVEKFDKNKQYECDIFFRNSVWGLVPENIKAKRMIEMRHADYYYLQQQNLLDCQYKSMGIKDIVACGDFVREQSIKALNDNPIAIKNILLPRRKTNKILKLISCTRLDARKGWNRMLQMMEMMRNAGIKFEWNIFTNSKQSCDFEEVHFWKQRYDIWDYLADADYTVLLSDSEGLPYTVQESLEYQVPCIVTNVGGCAELIKDGVNGYVVPLDMNFDINKILEIPKCPEYDNHALEDWLDYLGYDGEINKEEIIEKFEEEKDMKVKVRAKIRFYDVTETDEKGQGTLREAGVSEWICDEQRANFLLSKNAVDIIEYVEEPRFEIREEFKTEEIKTPKKKKTNKK